MLGPSRDASTSKFPIEVELDLENTFYFYSGVLPGH